MFHLVVGRIALCAALATGAETPAAVQTKPASSLARATAIFGAADSDRDGRISASEARAIPVSVETFAIEDEDRDGYWSRDEFLVFYRHQLVAMRQPIGSDLDAEITRVQALKRVEAVDAGRKPRCETSARSADASLVTQRFEQALSDVEAKCAARRASRDDFQRLRNLVVLNGRAASRESGCAPSPTAQAAVLGSIDGIERRSALGQYARDEFDGLRRVARAASGSASDSVRERTEEDPRSTTVVAESGARSPAAVPPAPPAAVPAVPPTVGKPANSGSPSAAGPAETRQRAQTTKGGAPDRSADRPAVRPAPAKASTPPARPASQKPEKDAPERSKP